MISGIAVRLSGDTAAAESPSPIYRLYPSLGMDENFNQYVIAKVVAGTRSAPQEHMTLLFCDANRNTALYPNGEALAPQLRLVDEHDVAQAIANLGYVLVDASQVEELEIIGKATAIAWYRANLTVAGEQNYADNNWGLFAAQYLVDNNKIDPPRPRTNEVPWKARAATARANARKERASYRDYLVG